jgi:hypothetical protein
MRSLAKPGVLGRALLAAAITSLACVPRLTRWAERGAPVLYLWSVLLFAMFVMWGFVFAWQLQYGGTPPIKLKIPAGLWGLATLYAVGAALMVHFFLDPQLRLLTPGEYPKTWRAWLNMGLFLLGLEPLFLCFAPYAFFIRLARKQDAALVLTVVFGIFILAMKLGSADPMPSVWLVIELMALRVLTGFASLYFYLKGGVLVIGWVALILHLRLALDLLAGG